MLRSNTVDLQLNTDMRRCQHRRLTLLREYRWTWHGRTWLALGGGVSLDKAGRAKGRDWWPQEEITDDQERAVIDAGHANVMVTTSASQSGAALARELTATSTAIGPG